jgi:hypothetical protein
MMMVVRQPPEPIAARSLRGDCAIAAALPAVVARTEIAKVVHIRRRIIGQ